MKKLKTQRRKIKPKPSPLICLISVPLWFAYALTHKTAYQESYFQQLMWRNPYNHALGKITVWDMVVRIGRNIWLMVDKVLPQMFLRRGNWIVGIIIVCLIALNLWRRKK
jgi:hypothetical protein